MDDLYQSIVNNPADDEARLVYADWLEEHGDMDRSTFIRAQIKLHNLIQNGLKVEGLEPVLRDKYLALKDTTRTLVSRGRGEEWAGELLQKVLFDYAKYPDRDVVVYERGFVGKVYLNLDDWLEHGPQMLRLHPITKVEILNKHPKNGNTASGAPYTWTFTELTAPFSLPPCLLPYATGKFFGPYWRGEPVLDTRHDGSVAPARRTLLRQFR